MGNRCIWCNELIQGDIQFYKNVIQKGKVYKSEEKFCSLKCAHEYPHAGTPEKGCFIATAVYNDYNHPVVLDLREFRDNYLEKNRVGRNFISWYYTHSPKWADKIKEKNTLKWIAFIIVVKPLHILVKILFSRQKDKLQIGSKDRI